MNLTAILFTLIVLASCSSPVALRYDKLTSLTQQEKPLPGTIVVVPVKDHRYDAEREGETMTTTWSIAFIGFAYSTFEGNYVTGDDAFIAYPGPFGNKSIDQSIGNFLKAVLENSRVAGSVRADPSAQIRWQCIHGTCVPERRDVLQAAQRNTARYVVAARLVHFFGTQFGESTDWVASYNETRGAYQYHVTESSREEKFSGAIGSAVIEVSVYEISNGRIVTATRRSIAGNAYQSATSSMSASRVTADAAVQALGEMLDASVIAVPEALEALQSY